MLTKKSQILVSALTALRNASPSSLINDTKLHSISQSIWQRQWDISPTKLRSRSLYYKRLLKSTTKIRCTTVKLSRVVQMTQKDTRQHRAQFYAGVTSVISIELHLNKARTNTVVRQTQYIHSTLRLWLQLKRSSSKRDVSISYVSIINSIWNHSFFLMGGNYFILEDYCIKHLSKWIYYT